MIAETEVVTFATGAKVLIPKDYVLPKSEVPVLRGVFLTKESLLNGRRICLQQPYACGHVDFLSQLTVGAYNSVGASGGFSFSYKVESVSQACVYIPELFMWAFWNVAEDFFKY